MLKKTSLVFAFFCLSALLISSTTEKKQKAVKTIIIDAGHGGTDPGCNGKISHEADVALAVALELGDIIKKNLPDVKVIYTRDKDFFVKLNDRAMIANDNGADLFVSLHCNSGQEAAYGTETYTMGIHNSTGTTGNLDEQICR